MQQTNEEFDPGALLTGLLHPDLVVRTMNTGRVEDEAGYLFI